MEVKQVWHKYEYTTSSPATNFLLFPILATLDSLKNALFILWLVPFQRDVTKGGKQMCSMAGRDLDAAVMESVAHPANITCLEHNVYSG